MNIFAFIFKNGRIDKLMKNDFLKEREEDTNGSWTALNVLCFVAITLELWKCFAYSCIQTHTYIKSWEDPSWAHVRLTGRLAEMPAELTGKPPIWVLPNSLGGKCPYAAPELRLPETVRTGRGEHSEAWKRHPSASRVPLMSSNDKA